MSDLPYAELRRFKHQQGQSLLSSDFNDQLHDAGQRAWWHNRAAHDAFGIAHGFEATCEPKSAALPSRVFVSPGVAYDHRGREMLLPEQATIETPNRSPGKGDRWALLIRYAPREDLPPSGGLCDGAHRRESPQFIWKPLRQVTRQEGVLLLAGRIEGGKFQFDDSIAPPRAARLAVPRIAHGATLLGKTAWRSLETTETETYQAEWLTVTVTTDEHQFLDIRGDGFRSTPPQFLACVAGFLRDDISVSVPLVVNESAQGFDCLTLVVRQSARTGSFLRRDALRQNNLLRFGLLFDIARSMAREESSDPSTQDKSSEKAALRLRKAPSEAEGVASVLEFARRYLHIRWTGVQSLSPIATTPAEESQAEESSP